MLWKLPLYVGKQLDQFSDNQMRWRNRKVTDPGPVSLPWSSPWISVSPSVEWSLEALSPPPILPSEVLRFGVRPENLFKKLYILSYLKNRDLPPSGSLFKTLHQPGLAQAEAQSPELNPGLAGRGPNTGVIHCCLLGSTFTGSRGQGWNWDLNSDMASLTLQPTPVPGESDL